MFNLIHSEHKYARKFKDLYFVFYVYPTLHIYTYIADTRSTQIGQYVFLMDRNNWLLRICPTLGPWLLEGIGVKRL
jgi:hypothetical protein